MPVVHVFNDPVNHTISGGTAYVFGDNVTWNIEIISVSIGAAVNQFSEYSAGNTYESSEMFNFYSKMSDLNDPELDSVPVTISWSRVGQFLPWMRAGQTPGKLIYHTNGQKLLGGFEELPQHLKDYVRENAPKYMTAPETDVSPNETSWRVFRKLLDAGEMPECE